MTRSTILGISPGSRACGIAIYRHGMLDYLKVCSKNIPGMVEVQSILSQQDLQMMAVMETHPSRGSPATREALGRLISMAHEQHLAISTYPMERLKKRMGGFRNKRELFKHLSILFPELSLPYYKSLRERNPYWTKLLEAVACAYVATL